MKNKLIGVVVFAWILMTGSIMPVQANNFTPPADKELSVAFKGVEGEFLVFMVFIENKGGKRKMLNISDQNGHELFTKVFYGEKVEGKFKIPKADLQRVTFTFKQQGNISTKTFVISTHYEEKTEVEEQ